MEVTKHCRTCRHHTKNIRDRVVPYDDEDEDGAFEDFRAHDGSPEDIERYGAQQYEEEFSCMKKGGNLVGIGDDAGVGCDIWEAGMRGPSTISEALERRLAEFEARAQAEDVGDS